MSYFKAKMHQIRLRLGPYPARKAYSAPPGSIAGFKGPASKGRKVGKEGQRGDVKE